MLGKEEWVLDLKCLRMPLRLSAMKRIRNRDRYRIEVREEEEVVGEVDHQTIYKYI